VTPLSPADFPALFAALWGHPPFAWQTRLLERVRSEGWPSTLDLPTGSGKTAALDIALFALALDAYEKPEDRRQARRIVLVVDRRVVVDQAYERAVSIAQALAEARDGVLSDVAQALRSLQGDPGAPPVMPAILRGGMPRESEWARSPDQPVLLVSTVDQVGSRLLFRGYGVTDRMKPVHAGLLGRDTLYLLDEVHLSRPFEETLAAVARYGRSGGAGERLPRPLSFVRMSATVAARPADTFALGEAERAEPALAVRLRAAKRARLVEVRSPRDPERAREAVARRCVQEAERLAAAGSARVIAVIVNRVDTARRAAALAQGRAWEGWDVRLMTGRMRPLDRADLQAALLDRIRAGRERGDDRVLLVSTQAVEAGADFDFDALVSECASLDALRQRFGRLDRLGALGATDAVVVAASGDVDESAPPDPIYGPALRATWGWLQESAAASDGAKGGAVDFGADALEAQIESLDGEALTALLAPRSVAPILTQSHLDRWAQTSPIPSADPDVAPFLHGAERGSPDVQFVWRADIAEALAEGDVAFLRGALAAVPPGALEALSVPIWAARRWLPAVRARQRGEAAETPPPVTDVEGETPPPGDEPGEMAPVFAWRGDDSAILSSPDEVRPGNTLVVPSHYGGLATEFHCWDPDSTDPVHDRGDESHLLQRGRAAVRWSPAVLAGHGLPEALARGPRIDPDEFEDDGAAAERRAFEAWRSAVLAAEATPAWARLALGELGPGRRLVRLGDAAEAWRACWQPRRVPAAALRRLAGLPFLGAGPAESPATEDEGGSFTGVQGGVSLDRHLSGVEGFARRFAEALALPASVAGDVALAGRLHDLGKADPRFQLMLHGGDPVAHAMASEPLAKSAVPMSDRAARERARRRAGYPAGARHEVTSVALVAGSSDLRARAHDWELVLYLIASHHGWCRPFAPPVPDPEAVEVAVALEGIPLASSSDHGLARIDSGMAERFWSLVRGYGWWGLAWLEAVLRLADHRESEWETRHA
jgi:CRISPR-associated endonuclease/helicase Cas3